MHRLRVVSLDEARGVPVALQQRAQLGGRDAREHGGVGDLVAVEVQDRQHRAVVNGVQELVGVPARRQRPSLGLAVTNDAANEQIGVVKSRSVGVQQRVAELAALVNRTRCLRSDVAGNAAGEGELAEQPANPLLVARDVGVDLAVGALEVHVGEDPGATVTGTRDIQGIHIALADHPVHVRIDEVQARSRPPMSEQPRLYVLDRKRLTQQGIVEQIDLSDRQIVRRPPIGIQRAQFLTGERLAGHLGIVVHGKDSTLAPWHTSPPALQRS